MSRLVGSISKLLGLLKSVQDIKVSRSRVPFQKGQAVTNTAAVWRRRQHRRTFSVAVRSWRRNIRCVPFVTFINFIIIKVSYYLINIFIRNLLIFLVFSWHSSNSPNFSPGPQAILPAYLLGLKTFYSMPRDHRSQKLINICFLLALKQFS